MFPGGETHQTQGNKIPKTYLGAVAISLRPLMPFYDDGSVTVIFGLGAVAISLRPLMPFYDDGSVTVIFGLEAVA
jgi:hypothetical protein